MITIDTYLVHLIDVIEGSRYTNNPNDSGGPTKYGITLKTLSAYRKFEVGAIDIENLTREEAIAIYTENYVNKPGFARIANIDQMVALECIDTGINMGVNTATTFLQRALNVFSDNGANWSKLVVDGMCGAATINSIQAMRTMRGLEGMGILAIVLNCLQGNRYVELVENNVKNQTFIYGWVKNRIQVDIDNTKYGV